jgi:hypothetical protein
MVWSLNVINKSRNTIFKIALFTVTFQLISGCFLGMGGFADYEAPLPNKYRLVRTGRETISINNDLTSPDLSRRVVVGPKVNEINFTGDIVYGRVVKPSYEVPVLNSPEGYFILNTKTNEAQVGLKRNVRIQVAQTLDLQGFQIWRSRLNCCSLSISNEELAF